MSKDTKMQEDKDKGEYVEFDSPKELKKEGFRFKMEWFLGSRYFFVLIIILVAIIAYCLGRISNTNQDREPVRVYTPSPEQTAAVINTSSPNPPPNLGEESPTSSESTQVVASKNGSKYHYPWCPGAKQIAEKNLITFASPEAARSQGYTPASNCKGLK